MTMAPSFALNDFIEKFLLPKMQIGIYLFNHFPPFIGSNRKNDNTYMKNP